MSRHHHPTAKIRGAKIVPPDPFVVRSLERRFEEGKTFERAKDYEHAEKVYRELVSSFDRLNLNAASPNAALGYILLSLNKLDEAEAVLRRSAKQNPNLIEAYINLAAVHRLAERWNECIEESKRALKINERDIRARTNLGHAQLRLSQYGPAVQSFLLVLSLDQDNVDARKGIAESYVSLGEPDISIQMFRRVLEQDPDSWPFRSHLLFAMQYDPVMPNEKVFEEHLVYGNRVREVAGPEQLEFANPKTTERVLRVGYLSGDFKYHVVMRFVEHVLALHDRKKFRVVCIATNTKHDADTERIKGLADDWIDISRTKDDAAAQMILAKELDILVDLTGHTSINRLTLLGERMAPVQALWCGYSGTSGVDSVDYIVVDPVIAPEGERTFFVEKPLRLQSAYLSFTPRDAPEIGPLPYERNGYITFGCMNNPSKVNKYVVGWWAGILSAVPNSKLLMRYGLLADPLVKERIVKLMRNAGVPADRYELREGEKVFLNAYNEVDIALDTFPYNGTTTTCEALWMGVPVVTLRGDRFVARVGASLLTYTNLTEFIAEQPGEYVTKAIDLANNPERLVSFRKEARERLLPTLVYDTKAFTRGLEEAYLKIFRDWCQKTVADKNFSSLSENADMVLDGNAREASEEVDSGQRF